MLTSSATGLFAPKQGQAYREEQRRRRSQFDRGTPGAELEMTGLRDRFPDFEAHFPQLPFPSPAAYRHSASRKN